MKCQKEFDMNQNHIDTGTFWEFFNEHFQNALAGRTAYAIEKTSSGYVVLQEEQRAWRQEKANKKREERSWRNSLNKQNSYSKKMRFFRAV